MSAGVLAMLFGLFVVPGVLLWAGHNYKKRSARMRGAFWGGLIGHTLAALAASASALYRPVLWSDGDMARGLIGFWSMLLLGAIGMIIGGWLGAKGEDR
jgi:hypothetical protein